MKYFSDEKMNKLALALRNFAEEQAATENTAYWKILRNKAIISICKKLPRSIEEFSTKKVLLGDSKVEKYGSQIISIVEEYCNGPISDIVEPPPYIQQEKVMFIKQGGCYYNVSGNDALIFHKYLGYKLFGTKTLRTGFPVFAESSVLERLDNLRIDYDLLNQAGEILVSRRFDNNLYEVINDSSPRDEKKLERPLAENLGTYVTVLRGLINGVDISTGEVIGGLSEELKSQLGEMYNYFNYELRKSKGK